MSAGTSRPVNRESALGCGQPAIELIGERLPVFGCEVRRSPGDLASPAQFVKQVPNGKPLADVGFRVQLATRIEGLPALGNHLSRQRDVRSDHQIAGPGEVLVRIAAVGICRTDIELVQGIHGALVRGLRDTGSENYGGPIVTAGGLVFARS